MKGGKHMMPGGHMMPDAKMGMGARKPKRAVSRSKRRDQARKPSRGSGRY